MICAEAHALCGSELILMARSTGSSGWQAAVAPCDSESGARSLCPVLDFGSVFILTEANLGILGLGVAEPLPSWGTLLASWRVFSSLLHNPGALCHWSC